MEAWVEKGWNQIPLPVRNGKILRSQAVPYLDGEFDPFFGRKIECLPLYFYLGRHHFESRPLLSRQRHQPVAGELGSSSTVSPEVRRPGSNKIMTLGGN